ncbi:ribonuclease H-like domain-containing protein [Tanacetum coccineum]
MICTINNIIRSLLFHARLPPTFWVEALHMACHLLNILPSTAINNDIPFSRLYDCNPTYSHLRVFGFLCYPHLVVPHKLAPRSTPCIFLGYPSNNKGYRCLDLTSIRIIISRHVIFDKTVFPYGSMSPHHSSSYTFLDSDPSPISNEFLTSDFPTTRVPHAPSPAPTPTPPPSQPNPSPPPPPLFLNPPPPPPTHPMTTRSERGISKHVTRLNLHTDTISHIPKSYLQAIRDPNWKKAILDEYNALIKNRTWELVPRPPDVNVVRFMWLFKHKYLADGRLERYKARLVANCKSQRPGIDCDETFSHVV